MKAMTTTTIVLRHGTMLPFTTSSFEQLKKEIINAGFTQGLESHEIAAGGPSFHKDTKRVTLDGVICFGLPYWRLRIWDVMDDQNSRHPMA